jgi:hypothetical protein
MTRPDTRSHGFSFWNGAKLSFETMTPPTSSAMLITSASPRPSVPAGGCDPYLVPQPIRRRTLGPTSDGATMWSIVDGCRSFEGLSQPGIVQYIPPEQILPGDLTVYHADASHIALGGRGAVLGAPAPPGHALWRASAPCR